jgi:hypothetical protein
MAEETQSTNPVPEPLPVTPANVSQPINSPVPNIDHYKDLVEMSHRQIEWVQGKYKLAASILGILGVAIIGGAAVFIPKTINDLKAQIQNEATVSRLIIQRELELHKEKATTEFTNHLNKQIAEQFGEPRIKNTLKEVAETEAKGIIKEEVEPAVSEARNTSRSLQGELQQDVNKIRADFKNELEGLRHEVEFQKQFREIQRWQNFAITHCDFASYNRLDNYPTENADLDIAAKTTTLVIRGFIYPVLTSVTLIFHLK